MLPPQEEILKLLLALVAGASIGIEREYRDKVAGFRTMSLICVGACLFTQASLHMGGPTMRDPARIAAQIVTGVGFLGAGVIMREAGRVTGITTAATIWLTAALGMSIGGGFYGIALVGGIMVLLTLWILPLIERRIDASRETRTYRVVCRPGAEYAAVEALLGGSGLRLYDHARAKHTSGVLLFWSGQGPIHAHLRASDALIASDDVLEFTT